MPIIAQVTHVHKLQPDKKASTLMRACPKCQTEASASARFCPECAHEFASTLQKDAASRASAQHTYVGNEGTTINPGPGHTSAAELSPGTQVDNRYIIEDTIGRGGMGVVYRAKDKQNGTTLALKLIRPEYSSSETASKNLLAEGMTARNIRHPNVISVYDVGKWNDMPYITMEYLEKESLAQWHRNIHNSDKDVPFKIAARIIMEILDGVKAAHQAGVIHRDLKPENIILAEEPSEVTARLKILDFGIASASNRPPEPSTGGGMGTVGFMAPEQRRAPETVRQSADIFSISRIFYLLLVNVLPVDGWQAPSNGRSDVPRGIDALIQKGTLNYARSRHQSIDEYRQALIDALEPQPTPVSPDDPKDTGEEDYEWSFWRARRRKKPEGVSWLDHFIEENRLYHKHMPRWAKITFYSILGLAILGWMDEAGMFY